MQATRISQPCQLDFEGVVTWYVWKSDTRGHMPLSERNRSCYDWELPAFSIKSWSQCSSGRNPTLWLSRRPGHTLQNNAWTLHISCETLSPVISLHKSWPFERIKLSFRWDKYVTTHAFKVCHYIPTQPEIYWKRNLFCDARPLNLSIAKTKKSTKTMMNLVAIRGTVLSQLSWR